MKTLSWALASVASLAFAACGANSIDTSGGTTTGGATATTGGGTTTGVPIDYPQPDAGEAVGIGVDDIFPDVPLSGGAIANFSTTVTPDCGAKSGANKDCALANDCCTASSPNFVQSFSFADLYAQRKSPAEGGSNMRYAFIDISGAWCPHCQTEAAQLPTGYVAKWLAQGGVVFSILVQDNDPSDPCSLDTFFTWINHYQTNYPMSVDTQENMATTTSLKAWPGNIIIRLSDMHVMETVLGTDLNFYNDFTKQLTVCQNDPTNPNDCYAGSTCQSGTCVANAP